MRTPTTDIHYSKDLVDENMVTENEYDRLVFKKLGVYKSKESLIFAAKNNEFVYELLAHLKVTENIFNEDSNKSLRILMQLAIFLVLYKVSEVHPLYIKLKLSIHIFFNKLIKVFPTFLKIFKIIK